MRRLLLCDGCYNDDDDGDFGCDGDEDDDNDEDDDDDDSDSDQMKAGIYSATGATDHLKLPSLQGLGPSSSAQCTLHNVHIQVCKYTRILHYSSIQHTLYIETYTVAHSSSHMYTSLYTAHCTVHSFF